MKERHPPIQKSRKSRWRSAPNAGGFGEAGGVSDGSAIRGVYPEPSQRYNCTMIAIPQRQIEELCREYSVRRLWLFGSGTSDRFNPEQSDVDLLVEYQPGTNLGPWLKHYFEFKEALELLLGSSVDLVERSAIKNPYFLRNATKQERLLYAA